MVRKAFHSIKDLLSREQNEILSAAAVLVAIGLVTKVVGMLFMSMVARQFGTNDDIESFNLASVIPETITNIILLGAISGSIIPIFSKVNRDEDNKDFVKSFSNVMNVVMIFFIALALLAIIFSRQLIPLAVTLSNTKSEIVLSNAVSMMRIMLVSQVILGISAFLSTWLNIKQRFIIPQLAPLFYNLGKIAGISIFVPLMGGSIMGLVWGSLLGALLHLLIQLPLLRHLHFSWDIFHINRKDQNLKDAIRLGLPRTLSLGIEQAAVIVDKLIALSYTSLTVYSYAVSLIAFPLSLGTSFAIASFPSFSKLRAMGKGEEFSKLFLRIINEVIYLTLPLAVILVVLRVPVVRLVYGIFGGEFSWEDTLRVAWVVMFFALGVMFESLRAIIFRVYFSLKDTLTPFISSMFVLTGGIFSGILLSNYFSHFEHFRLTEIVFDWSYFVTRGDGQYGAIGLALSSSIIFSLEFFVLFFILWRKKVVIGVRRFIKKLVIKFLIALVMLAVCYVLAKLWEEILNTAKTVQLIILTITTSFASFTVYLLLSYIFSVEEVKIFLKLLNKILKLFKIVIKD